eukprot:scaffold5703_cov135-Isochrysis_galbana.AAC.2
MGCASQGDARPAIAGSAIAAMAPEPPQAIRAQERRATHLLEERRELADGYAGFGLGLTLLADARAPDLRVGSGKGHPGAPCRPVGRPTERICGRPRRQAIALSGHCTALARFGLQICAISPRAQIILIDR